MNEKELLLQGFDPISLDEMSGIKLMNRIDTKYVMPMCKLLQLLQLAVHDYLVQEVDGERDIPYHTVYLDTDDMKMFHAHASGRRVREKIRVRTYESSAMTFLEVKNKNHRGRTEKKRIKVPSLHGLEEHGGTEFLFENARFALDEVSPQLENKFQRITLVNKGRTERVTIDSEIVFHNLKNDVTVDFERIAVVELKREKKSDSPIFSMLKQFHVSSTGFSKYCMGCAYTDEAYQTKLLVSRMKRFHKMQEWDRKHRFMRE